jgi:uncharacterized phiE125 gp8 family phage protein
VIPARYGSSGSETAWHLVTPPAQEPIEVAEARRYLSLTQISDDAVIEPMIRFAREEAEDFMSRALFTQTWQLALRHFSAVMHLPRAWPLQNDANATPSTAPIVQYYDANDVLQTLSTSVYTVDTSARPGAISRATGQTWPTLSPGRPGARVLITYVCGYTDVALIPERIKQGIRMRLSAPYSDREGFDPSHARAREAAEACWSDVVYWIPPSHEAYGSGVYV